MGKNKIINDKETLENNTDVFRNSASSEILFALGVGFDKHFFKFSPSWDELNELIMLKMGIKNHKVIFEPRIKRFGPQYISNFISAMTNASPNKGEVKNVISEILTKTKNKFDNQNYNILLESNSHIITTNYRLPEKLLTNKKRDLVSFANFSEKFVPGIKTIFIHGNTINKDILFSDEDFAKMYSDRNSSKIISYIEKMSIKHIVFLGFSGIDKNFLNLFKNLSNIQKHFFTCDFNINESEYLLVKNMMNTLYSIENIYRFDRANISISNIIDSIILNSRGNGTRAISNRDIKIYIENNIKKKDFLYETWIQIEKDGLYKMSSNDFVNGFINHQHKLSAKDVADSKISDFNKINFLEKMIYKNIDAENAAQEILSNKYRFVSREVIDFIIKKDIGSRKTLSWALYFKHFGERSFSNEISAKELANVFQYDLQKKEISFILNYPKKITMKTWSDVDKTILTYQKATFSFSNDILNLNNTNSFINSIINSISYFFSQKKSQKSVLNFIKKKYVNREPELWLASLQALLMDRRVKNIMLTEIAGDDIEWVNKNINHLSKYNNDWAKIDMSGMNFDFNTNMNPMKYINLGMLTKNVEWQKSYIKKIENEDVISAVKKFDINAYVYAINKGRPSWTSRTLGDGQVDDFEKEYKHLIEIDPLDINHVYTSWLNNKTIISDDKLLNFFKKIKNMSFNSSQKILNDYNESKNLQEFVINKIMEKFSDLSKNNKLMISDFLTYVEIKPLSNISGNVINSLKDKDYRMFSLMNRSFFDNLVKNFSKKHQGNEIIDRNSILFVLENLYVDERTLDTIKIWLAYYIFTKFDSIEKILNKYINEPKYLMSLVLVLISNTTYSGKNVCERITNYLLQIDLLSIFNFDVNESGRYFDDIGRYNTWFEIVKCFYVSEKIELLKPYPNVVDILMYILLKQKKINKSSEIFKLLENFDFSNVLLQRVSNKEILKIPKSIFNKIITNSPEIELEKIIAYSNKNKLKNEIENIILKNIKKRIPNNPMYLSKDVIKNAKNNNLYLKIKMENNDHITLLEDIAR